MDTLFRLCLLGIPRVTQNGQPVNGLRTRKALALLCYLAARSTNAESSVPLSRTHLADLFWNDLPEAKGRSNLSYTLHNLNDLFPDALRTTRDTIAMDRGVFKVDTHEFEAYAALGTADSLASAAALYHDEFLAGLFLDDCPEFEVWLVSEREHWRQRIVSALECVSDYYLRRVEYERALPFAARILEIEPWREEAHRRLMDLLARTGQRSAALQQYETCRRVLAAELGAEPGSETLALYERIRAEEISPPPVSSAHNLPTQLTSFVGREADLARIDARLKNPDCRLLTLVGAGGIGKTRLALEAGAKHLDTFLDGVFLVPLASLMPGQSEFIIPAIANALAFSFAGPEDPKTQLLNFLCGKRMLLLLDNFEQLLSRADGAKGTGLVLEILQGAPNVKIIVTSRAPLDVQAEWLTRVTGLSYPTSTPAVSSHTHEPSGTLRNDVSPSAVTVQEDGGWETLSHYSAVHLFVERASRVDEAFTFDAKTTAPVIHICQSVEGTPLALELAASALKSLPVAKIAQQLAMNVDLATTMRDVEPRHQSLRAVLDWSYALLSEPEQTMFRRLAVLAGGCSLEAAIEVCAHGKIEPTHIPRLMSDLVGKSLLLKQEQAEASRYRMLEPVRQYGREKLAESGETQGVQTRYLKYFIKFAEQAEPRLQTIEQDVWLEKLDIENDNLRAALGWGQAIAENQGQELQLAGSLIWFWLRRGYLSEGRDWLTVSLQTSQLSGPSTERAKALFGLGVLALEQGDLTIAREGLDKSIAISRECGDKQHLSYALAWRGWIEIHQGNFDGAFNMLQESLQLARLIEDRWGIAYAVSLLHLFSAQRLDFQAARTYGEEGVALFRQIGDKWGLTWLLQRVGQFYYTFERDFAKAQSLLEESVCLAREWKNKKLTADTLWQLGLLAVFQQDPTRATILAEEALTLGCEIRNKEITFRALNVLGEAARVERDYTRAAARYDEALRLARALGSMRVIGMTAINLGFARLRENDCLGAAQLLAESLQVLERTQDKTLLATCLAAAGATAVATRRLSQAVRLLSAADAQFASNGTSLEPLDQVEYDHYLELARTQLGASEFNAAWAGGRVMTKQQAVQDALDVSKYEDRKHGKCTAPTS